MTGSWFRRRARRSRLWVSYAERASLRLWVASLKYFTALFLFFPQASLRLRIISCNSTPSHPTLSRGPPSRRMGRPPPLLTRYGRDRSLTCKHVSISTHPPSEPFSRASSTRMIVVSGSRTFVRSNTTYRALCPKARVAARTAKGAGHGSWQFDDRYREVRRLRIVRRETTRTIRSIATRHAWCVLYLNAGRSTSSRSILSKIST